MDENEIRKVIWDRKAAVDALMADSEFYDLPGEEQDARVLGLHLGLPYETMRACVDGTAAESDVELARARIAEAFKYGKRKALRTLKIAISRYAQLQ